MAWLFVALCLVTAHALDNGLGRRPGLGWNSDYCANCTGPPTGAGKLGAEVRGFGGEHFIKFIADYMHSAGQPGASGHTLQQLGFHYVNMDSHWDVLSRDSDGKLVPDSGLWPSGLAHTVSYLHSLGLGFGLYGDRGTKDCSKHPGNLGHEVSDAKQYAEWEIDWYKEDSCYASGDKATAFKEYEAMRDALNATGRPIWFAMCGWKPWYGPPDPSLGYPGGKSVGNSWRIGMDTGSGWTAVMINIRNALAVHAYAGPSGHGGGWNDGSLLLTPGMGCKTPEKCMDETRQRSQYSAWCMLAMNLLLTGNFSGLSPSVMEIWTNPEIISINQDPLGRPASRLNSTTITSVQVGGEHHPRAMLAECGGEPSFQQWMLHKENGTIYNAKANVCLNVKGCKTDLIYDDCVINASRTCGANEQFKPNKAGQFKSFLPGSKCITENADHTLSISACDSDEPLQHFQFSDGQFLDKDNLCLTAAAPAPPPPPPSANYISMGRPLSGDRDGGAAAAAATISGGGVVREPGWAVMFLNNDAAEVTMSCEKACLIDLGLKSSTVYAVRDVWSHVVVATIGGSAAFSLSAKVTGGGGSRVFRLSVVTEYAHEYV